MAAPQTIPHATTTAAAATDTATATAGDDVHMAVSLATLLHSSSSGGGGGGGGSLPCGPGVATLADGTPFSISIASLNSVRGSAASQARMTIVFNSNEELMTWINNLLLHKGAQGGDHSDDREITKKLSGWIRDVALSAIGPMTVYREYHGVRGSHRSFLIASIVLLYISGVMALLVWLRSLEKLDNAPAAPLRAKSLKTMATTVFLVSFTAAVVACLHI